MELYVHTGKALTDGMLTAALRLWENTIPVLRAAATVVVTSEDLLPLEALPEGDLVIVCLAGEERVSSLPSRYKDAIWIPMPVSLPLLEKALTEYAHVSPPPEACPEAAQAAQHSPALHLSSDGWLVQLGKETVRLTETEFALLELLYTRRGQIVSKEELRSAVWPEGVSGNVCEVHMTHLRKKLAALLGEGVLVSVRGKGYLLH